MRKTEAERLFFEEVREKKRTGRGIYNRKGKRGYVGALYLTYDLLKGKEKRAYAKAGKVKVSNLYDKVLSKEEFLELSEEDQKRRLAHWRKVYKTADIYKTMGISSNSFYKLIDKLGIKKESRGNNANLHKKSLLPNREYKKQEQSVAIQPQAEASAKEEKPAVQEILFHGLSLAINGEYSVEQLQSKLERIGLMLDGENEKFRVELKLYELAK